MLVKAKHSEQAYQRETVPFLGLNRSDDVREGEFAAQKNMSDRRYPYLAPRLPRTKETYTEPTALFAWNGKEIRVEGGMLYYDGETLCNVLDGPKQFAVVNTKLVVWPDKLTVDLENKKVAQMFASVTNKGTASFTTNSLKLEPSTIYTSGSNKIGWSNNQNAWAWTYSSVAWSQDGGWILEGGEITNLRAGDGTGRYYIPQVSWSASTNSYVINPLPNILFATAKPNASAFPETEDNDLGFYSLFTGTGEAEATTTVGYIYLNWESYWAQEDNQPLNEVFAVGDIVSIEGSLCGYHDKEGVKIQRVDASTNTLIFENTFGVGDAIYQATADLASEKKYFSYNDVATNTTKRFSYQTGTVSVKAGDILLIDGTNLHILDKTFTIVRTLKLTEVTSVGTGSDRLTLTALSPQKAPVKVSREIPALDYICEHENRLWGVSNADKTIYASALGDPNNFYDYTGESGGYAVAVGSEGDFTGICSYGNAVLCWKERSLHKVLGSYPSNYQTAFYRFAGVRSGANKSLVNVNEALFFLGPDGVYAFTGNKPALISRALGADVLADGVGGTDGRLYYLSVRRGEEWELLTYDSHTGLWCRSDEVQVVDFCQVDDKLKFLAGDSIYTVGGGDEQVEWEAVLAPMYETLEGGKQYNRLLFRVEVPKGSWMAADVRFDGGRWMQVGIVRGQTGPVTMQVPLRWCDKFEVRLRGVGDCAVLDMVREFRLRGDR